VSQETDDACIALAIVRGEMPISAFAKAGVSMTFRKKDAEGKSREIVITQERPFELRPTVADVATGLLNHVAELKQLSDWATLLQAADWIDFASAEDHPDWDILITALWDASFSGKVEKAAIDAAKRMTSPTGN
jgi:hypothetical protein